MTIEKGKIKVTEFIKQADKDGDPYLIVHFSRQQDQFSGISERMDIADGLIVIKNLINELQIDKDVLKAML